MLSELPLILDSFIRQWHSYSRLRLTREMFDDIVSEFEIFPRFREFVMLFGCKIRENDIGPPQMRFRRLVDNAEDPVEAVCTGFGKHRGKRSSTVSNTSRMCLWLEVRGIEQP